MNREKISSFLINSTANNLGGIPIFLIVDNAESIVDLKKMHSFLILGENSDESINNIIEQLDMRYIQKIKNVEDLNMVYNEIKNRLSMGDTYFPYQVVIIPDISIFSDTEKTILREILNKGCSVNSYFVCACKTNTDADKYNVAIPVKMYEEYVNEMNERIDNLFTFVGTVKKIVKQCKISDAFYK